MAENNNDFKELEKFSRDTNATIFGIDSEFEKDNELAISIVNDTLKNIKRKYEDRSGEEGLIDYIRGKEWQRLWVQNNPDIEVDGKTNTIINKNEFKNLMADRGFQYLNNIKLEDSDKAKLRRNFRAIYEHIPQAAQACDLYMYNITSPDDFNKTIFDVSYEDTSNLERKNDVEKNVEKLTDKYDLEDLAGEIIHNVLIDSDVYLNVVSIEDDVDFMLNKFDDGDLISEQYLTEEVNEQAYIEGWSLNENQQDAFSMLYEEVDSKEDEKVELTEEQMRKDIVDLVNDRVTIIDSRASRIEFLSLLQETKYQNLNEEVNSTGFDPLAILKNNKETGRTTKYSEDDKFMGLNGSSINLLDPSKTIEISINNKCYGYYVIEEDDSKPEFTTRFQQKTYGNAIDSYNGNFNPNRFI